MTLLQQDDLEVVQRHIQAVAQNKPVQFNVKKEGDVDLFEMQVELHASRGNAGASGNRSGSSRVSMGGSTK